MPDNPCVVTPRFDLRMNAGEVPLVFTRARLRSPRPGGTGGVSWFGPILTIVGLVRFIWHSIAARQARALIPVGGVPLKSTMAILVTSQRVIFWDTRPLRLRAPTLLGTLSRDEITSARLPYVGGGWRTVELRYADGFGLRFLAEPSKAQEFVDAFGSPDVDVADDRIDHPLAAAHPGQTPSRWTRLRDNWRSLG